jgi:hypothetical protein
MTCPPLQLNSLSFQLVQESPVTSRVRALAYIIAGHEIHHRKILQEKYLVNPT